MQATKNTSIQHFLHTLKIYQGAILFIRQHRLWDGLTQYGWLTRFLMLAGIFVGLKFFSIFMRWLMQAAQTDTAHLFSMATGMFTDIFREGYGSLFGGGTKYLMLILLEVIIFHISRRTLEILQGNTDADLSFDAFMRAQVRMIKVAVYAWVMSMIIIKLIGIPLGMLGISFTKPFFAWLVHSYFLGFAVIDNFNEQYHLSVKKSAKYTLQYVGIAMAVGCVLYVLMLIPVAGPILGPVLAAVTATVAMYELSDLPQRKALPPLAAEETV